jgi:transglutaminase-like putative cysteine protease
MSDELDLREANLVIWLVTGMLLTVGWAINEAGWTKGLNVLLFVVVGAIIIGMMIVRSSLPRIIGHLFSLIIGLGWSFWVTSRLLPPSFTWAARWENMVMRLLNWYEKARQGGTSYDNLMFIFQMALITWLVSYLTIWLLFHSRKVWPAILPGGVVILINFYYAPHDLTFWLLLYLVLALLLIIRFNLAEYQRTWRAEHIYFRPDINFDFLRDGVVFSVLLLGLAWFIPSIVKPPSVEFFEQFEGTWNDVQGDWNRMFASLNYRPTRRVDTFGQSLALGGPRHLTNEPVMDVTSEVGRYWRAAVYDEYTGLGWRSNDDSAVNIGPTTLSGEPPAFAQRRAVTQTYTLLRGGGFVMYAVANPTWTSLEARAHTRFILDEQLSAQDQALWPNTEKPLTQDLTYLKSRSGIDSGDSYQVRSEVSVAAVEDLRLAGSDYPQWVTERYLQLPEGIPQRVLDLAGQITAAKDNPFDQAEAIETYLRTNLEYNEGIEAPPPGRDKVDYILFELRQAYCDYYATSAIVLLRSLGIPARMAAGFAGGVYDSEVNVYHVLNRNAHSWIEVYFPHYGWVEFEPTAAQPTILRLRRDENEGPASGAFSPDSEAFAPFDRVEDNPPLGDESGLGALLPFLTFTLPFLGTVQVPRAIVNWGTAFLLVALVAGGVLAWRRFWIPLSQATTTGIFGQMLWLARWIGLRFGPWQTPYEKAGEIKASMPEGQAQVDLIAHEYVRDQFSHHSPDAGEQHRVDRAWQRLRSLMLRRVVQRLTEQILGKLGRNTP